MKKVNEYKEYCKKENIKMGLKESLDKFYKKKVKNYE